MLVDEPPAKATCRFQKQNGASCRRSVSQGEEYCWQHARSLRSKWKSLTRNQTLVFLATIFGLLIGVASVLWGLFHPAPSKEEIANEVVRDLLPTPKPAFSATIEFTFFSGAQGDEYSTPFAVARGWATACMVYPAQVVFYLRIKNERPTSTMVTAYVIRANDKPFLRLKTDNARAVMLVESGTYRGGDVRKVSRLPQGTGQASYVKVPVKNLDWKHAFPFTPTTFDQQIVGKTIEPGQSVQGFAFFDYPFDGYFLDPKELWIDVTDDSGKKTSFPIAMETGDPNADAGSRTLGIDNPVDLSRCRIMPPHPAP